MRINAAKTKVMTALLPPEAQQPILLDGTPLEMVDHFTYLGSSFVPNGQGGDEIERRINLARVAFNRLQKCLWSRREIALRTKSRVYQAVVRSILLYGCETWPVRVADLKKVEVFDNDCLRRILCFRRIDRVRTSTLRQTCRLQPIPAALRLRRLRWFGHAARRPPGELVRDCLLPRPLPGWRKRAGGQLKTWATTLKEDLEPISGPNVVGLRRWKRDWAEIGVELAQDRRSWAAAERDASNVLGDAGSTRPKG